MGKTERALSWFGSERTLVVNCQNITTPDLKEMQDGVWTAILFDEANWELVSHNRALFQANDKRLTLGQSSTNAHSYSLCLLGVPMLLCSNRFWSN